MRLLIAGMNYRPEPTGIGPFTTGLAEHLAARGHDVVVSTTFPHYPQWRWQEAGGAPPHRRTELVDGVEVRRMRVVLPRRPCLSWRLAYDTSLAGTTLASAFAMPPADVVVCVSPPIQLAFAGALLARRWGAPLVLAVKDLPLDAALAIGMVREGAAVRAGRWLERTAYAMASRIVVITRRFGTALATCGVPPAKVVEIPDWAELDKVRPSRALDPDARARLGGGDGRMLVLHAGSMGGKQALDCAVRAVMPGVGGVPPAALALVGDGPERPGLEALGVATGAAVTVLPLQPEAEFLRLLGAADACLLSQRADVRDSVAPSKLMTYMAAGRPVLTAAHTESAAAHLVREAGCGVVVPPEDPAALAAAMRALAADPERRRTLGEAGRRFAERRFERGSVLARWESLLATVAGDGGDASSTDVEETRAPAVASVPGDLHR